MGLMVARGPAVLLIGSVLFTHQTPAQAAPTDNPDPQRQAAQIYFQRGNEAAATNHLDEAASLYREAWAQSPNLAIACNLGLVEFERANYPAAAEFLTRCMERIPQPGQEKQRAEQLEALEKARRKVGTIYVEITDPKAEIRIDDRIVSGGALGPFFVEPGPHRLRARAGDRSAVATADVAAGASKTVALTLAPAEHSSPAVPIAPSAPLTAPTPIAPSTPLTTSMPAPAPSSPAPLTLPTLAPPPLAEKAARHTLSSGAILLAGGAGVGASLAFGASFTVAANNKGADVHAMAPLIAISKLDGRCVDGAIIGVCGPYEAARSTWRTYSGLATAGFAVSGVAAVATGALLITSRMKIAPALTASGLGVVGLW